jgi:hypothetical protein
VGNAGDAILSSSFNVWNLGSLHNLLPVGAAALRWSSAMLGRPVRKERATSVFYMMDVCSRLCHKKLSLTVLLTHDLLDPRLQTDAIILLQTARLILCTASVAAVPKPSQTTSHITREFVTPHHMTGAEISARTVRLNAHHADCGFRIQLGQLAQLEDLEHPACKPKHCIIPGLSNVRIRVTLGRCVLTFSQTRSVTHPAVRTLIRVGLSNTHIVANCCLCSRRTLFVRCLSSLGFTACRAVLGPSLSALFTSHAAQNSMRGSFVPHSGVQPA